MKISTHEVRSLSHAVKYLRGSIFRYVLEGKKLPLSFGPVRILAVSARPRLAGPIGRLPV